MRRNIAGWATVAVIALSSSSAAAAIIGVIDAGASDFLATLNPVNGAVSQLGSATFPEGYYAPVYDPLNNTVYLTGLPISNGSSINVVRSFNATTGAETNILFDSAGGTHTVTGLAVAIQSSSVPEPPTLALLALCFAGLAIGKRKRN